MAFKQKFVYLNNMSWEKSFFGTKKTVWSRFIQNLDDTRDYI